MRQQLQVLTPGSQAWQPGARSSVTPSPAPQQPARPEGRQGQLQTREKDSAQVSREQPRGSLPAAANRVHEVLRATACD